jgi:hypothetical protein
MYKIEHNVATGEIIEIPLTDKEIKELEKEQAELEKINKIIQDEAEAKVTAKAALLAQLGITEEQARLLLS